jgi:tRNA(Arg) A34 adenosine deaminase TadA
MIDKAEIPHLERCIELAVRAMEAGEEPFGSVLVDGNGTVLAEDHNRITSTDDETAHPEFALARWAAANMTREERARATVYTSGEHCPMCSAAHGWVGLGRIVYAASSAQLTEWRTGWGWPPSPVAPIPAQDVAPGVTVEGPVPDLAERMREVHHRFHSAGSQNNP